MVDKSPEPEKRNGHRDFDVLVSRIEAWVDRLELVTERLEKLEQRRGE